MGFPSSDAVSQGIVLPPLQCEAFVSQRHEVNPALALNLLQEIQVSVGTWQGQQRQIVQALQRLYAQGPMVDGWLQSSLPVAAPQPADASATILRHGDAEALMKYVESLESSTLENSTLESSTLENNALEESNILEHSPVTQYHLCSLQEDGSVHSQHCPPEQTAFVGTAIARYQKFKQLMDQKQAIEAKLQQAVDLLSGVRAQLQLD